LPHQLVREFKNWVEVNGLPPEEESAPVRSAPETEPGATAAAEVQEPTDKTMIFSGRGIRTQSLHDFLSESGPANGETAPPPEIITHDIATATRWDNFTKVSFQDLNAYDARVLRRFAAQVVNHGGASETLMDEKIATIIRNIRGQESGNNPPCVDALRRMGVLVGGSGTYRLRPEFIQRFSEVRIWAEV
jgi:hypothetical protein